jgi:general secretion pathway protein B
MSYILDALNKSEQERRAQKTPDLGSIHRAPPTRNVHSKGWYIGIGLILVSINIAGLAWWQQTSKPVDAATASAMAQTPSQSRVEQNDLSKPTSVPSSQKKASSTLITSSSNSTNGQIIPASQLPMDIQRAMPLLTISSHVYSTDPSLRMVNINGSMMNEGEYVAEDFLLDEITEEGAVIRHQTYRFRITF